jgi:surfactin synthase thioesterase subunit
MKRVKLSGTNRPKARLYLFSHAGGSALTFQVWRKKFPDNLDFDVHVIELPNRIFPFETDFSTLEDLIQEIAGFIKQDATCMPVGLFGQSMGGLLAYEIASLVEHAPEANICWVGVANCSPPCLKRGTSHHGERHTFSDDELIKYLITLDYEQGVLFHDKEFRELFLPVVRKDLELLENYAARSNGSLNSAPLSVFLGNQDPTLNFNEMSLWKYKTKAAFEISIYEGGHNLLNGNDEHLRNDIIRMFSQACETFWCKGKF